MSKSIGQIIKELRKERNLTQEELAELLNISGQAISKWENEMCMPDVSQIVPIAKAFGVSTDVLFGTFGESDDDAAMEIIRKAQKQKYDENGRYTINSIYSAYLTEQEGLKRYPNNILLLLNNLETGLSLAYPDNDCYDAEHAKAIYEESIRQSDIIISYGKNTADVLRAHMIMVLLHSAFGNFNLAEEHSCQFPTRADMTSFNMSAFLCHAEHKYAEESTFRQYDFAYLFEALLDNMVNNGNALFLCGKYDDALTVFTSANTLIETVFKDEAFLPSVHIRDSGDLYDLIAKTYTKLGNMDKAIEWLRKMVDYELVTRRKYTDDMKLKTPLLGAAIFLNYYRNFKSCNGYSDSLLEKLGNSAYDKLKDNEAYRIILKSISEKMTDKYKKHLADIITALRIAAAIVMLFFPPLTVPFFVFYTVCGISDMVDGTVARKLGTADVFGARLDSIADFVFFLSAAFKLLPTLWSLLSVVSLWLIAAVTVIKCTSAVIGAVRFRKLCFLHTYLNKLTGAAVFLLPYFCRAECFSVPIYIVCAVAFLAAIEEMACLIRMKEYNAENKSFYRLTKSSQK